LEILYKKQKDPKKTAEQYEILEKFKGSTLKGTRYVPLFNYFIDYKERGAFQVCSLSHPSRSCSELSISIGFAVVVGLRC